MGSYEGRPGENRSTTINYWNNVIKSPEDKRSYRVIQLPNEMKIILISDPDTEKSAAALDVNVGSLSDPIDLLGLAHFCEHMLFLGTYKYPDTNDFLRYVTTHGGHYNASTLADHTLYYFDITPNYFRGALDRFAQFFISPLFNEEWTVKEVDAIHSEFEKNYGKDYWRLDQLDRHASKPGHPYKKFANGNIDTLINAPRERGLNIQNELRRFHDKWYSSNIMTVAILGKESLNKLEITAVALFSSVPNKNAERVEWNDHPFGPEQVKSLNYVVPNRNIRSLHISFPTPDFDQCYKTKPFHYMASLIGHEGSGSLLSELKKRKWSDRLISGSKIGGRGFGIFYIKIDLTEEGIEKVDDIVKLCFQYIKLLSTKGPQKWFFDEFQSIFDAAFRYKEKEQPYSYVTNVAKNLQMYPVEEVLKAPYILEKWDPEVITKLTDLLVPSNVRLAVVGRKFEGITNKKEPWFGTRYKQEKIPERKIRDWENCGLCPDLDLPKANQFIPTNFEIMPREESSAFPIIIQETSMIRLWFKQDEKFLLPRTNINVEFFSPFAYVDPLNCNLSRVFCQLVEDILSEYSYDADLAGLGWEMKNTEYGVLLTIAGYNDKQTMLIDKIFETMTTLKVEPERFELLKENYIKSLVNFDLQPPYEQTAYYVSALISDFAWKTDELLAATKEMSAERLEEFIPQFFSKIFIECLIHGNVTKEKALEITSIMETRLKTLKYIKPLMPLHLLRKREIQFLDGANFNFEVRNEHNKASCAEVYYQCDVQSTPENMLVELLVQIMTEPTFAILRNEEQLGYLVSSGIRRSNSSQGLRVVVQSVKHPLYIDQRIEAFLVKVRDIIVDLSDFEFKEHKDALANLLLEKSKTLLCDTRKYWKEISLQQYHFNRAEEEVAYLRKITKHELLEFFDTYIKYNAPQRHKLAVHVLSMADGGAGKSPTPDVESLNSSINEWVRPPPFLQPTLIEDVTQYKRSHAIFPLLEPRMSLSFFK